MKSRVGTIKSDKSPKSGIFVCGQFYPNKHRLDFTIADAGIGIRENVRRHLGKPKMSSCKAIQWALEEGHSTRISSQPGGLGLKLLKDFIKLNKGRIQIVSRFGFYEFSASKEKWLLPSLHSQKNSFYEQPTHHTLQ